ncbi:uncharacterized protein TNCV_1153221 [Trichonephila clavipes]|nr:uncharacterized protein TNCV_1153221 [Trichonephila clavipes]
MKNCAHPSIRDHWALRFMSRCPDQAVSLKRDPQCLSPQASLVLTYRRIAVGIADSHHARLWRDVKALFKAWSFRRFQVPQLCFSYGFFKKRPVMARRKQRPAFDQVSEFHRGRIVAYRDCGLSFREIGSHVGRNQTTVMRICDHWMQEGTTDRRGRSHPP